MALNARTCVVLLTEVMLATCTATVCPVVRSTTSDWLIGMVIAKVAAKLP